MALGDETLRGEVYKAIVTRVQEQEVEVEILEDGEVLHEAIWDSVDLSSWDTVQRQVDTLERITCAGEV